MSLENKRTTYKDLLDNFKEMDNLDDSVTTARLLLGRDLRKIDIETDNVVGLIVIVSIYSFFSDILALVESIYCGHPTKSLCSEWDPDFACSSSSRDHGFRAL